MEDLTVAGIGGLHAATQWLWSKPLGQQVAEDDDEETVDALTEEAEIEGGLARHLCFLKTTSREVPVEQSRSGRLYQTAQHSVLEYSRPTMSIKSQWSRWSSSPRPLPPPPGRSLTSLIPTASPRAYNPMSTNLASLEMDNAPGQGGLLTGLSGMTPRKINSGSFTKEMVPTQLRDHSGSPLSVKLKTRNR
uniref:Movement protein n=1 Tax=Cowpea polerovirus 1 TaxID=1913124 RepID=A0A1I9W7A9_9VIRU|nr:movement protein [Cowpea polerovirus 1]